MSDDVGAKISEEVTKIFSEIPDRLNIVGILRDAHARLSAIGGDVPADMLAMQVVEVLREIAGHAVKEFENRTGQQFLWVDAPDEPEEMIMSIGVTVKDGKGHVTF